MNFFSVFWNNGYFYVLPHFFYQVLDNHSGHFDETLLCSPYFDTPGMVSSLLIWHCFLSVNVIYYYSIPELVSTVSTNTNKWAYWVFPFWSMLNCWSSFGFYPSFKFGMNTELHSRYNRLSPYNTFSVYVLVCHA